MKHKDINKYSWSERERKNNGVETILPKDGVHDL